jgi:hypothetical protein
MPAIATVETNRNRVVARLEREGCSFGTAVRTTSSSIRTERAESSFHVTGRFPRASHAA